MINKTSLGLVVISLIVLIYFISETGMSFYTLFSLAVLIFFTCDSFNVFSKKRKKVKNEERR